MKWHLTQGEADQPEIDIREDDEDLTVGYAYWRALAQTEENPNFWVDSGSGPGYLQPTPRADS